jgi:hypothetical protein
VPDEEVFQPVWQFSEATQAVFFALRLRRANQTKNAYGVHQPYAVNKLAALPSSSSQQLFSAALTVALTVALLSALTVAPLSSSSQQLFSAALTVVLAVAPLSGSYSGSYSSSSQRSYSSSFSGSYGSA